MIVQKSPNFQIPKKLPQGAPLAAPGSGLPVSAPQGWQRNLLAGTGGLLGSQAALANAEQSEQLTGAGSDLICDSIEFLTGKSTSALRYANSFIPTPNLPGAEGAGVLDIASPSGKQLLASLGQIVDSLDENPVNVTVGICVALTQTVVNYWGKEIDAGTASLEVLAAGLNGARVIAKANGYEGVASGLLTVGFLVKAGKNMRVVYRSAK